MQLLKRSLPASRPVRVMQFGEGNFLRGFIDWFIQILNDKCNFDGQVQVIKPRAGGDTAAFNEQGGLYTLLLQGMENDKPAEKQLLIDSVNGCINPYSNWAETVECACLPTLRFVFSNTTEAGIEYKQEPYTPEKSQITFPAKLASLLFQRFLHFNGANNAGLIVIPCELLENNGDKLKQCIKNYAADWKLPTAFTQWIDNSCFFYNSLVDRIVAGFPKDNAEEIQKNLGYRDNFIVRGELFHFMALEGPQMLTDELPFHKAGLNVIITDDLTPYRTRKVRFLNGAHTCCTPAAILAGMTFVDEMVQEQHTGPFLHNAVFNEVFPTVTLPAEEKEFFAKSVIERFKNPYAKHRLLSIALNCVSKWKVRVLPTLLDYVKINGKLPVCLAFSLAALLRFYFIQIKDGEAIGYAENFTYPVNDATDVLHFFHDEYARFKENRDTATFVHNALSNQQLWEMDLTSIPELEKFVIGSLENIVKNGIIYAMENL